MAGATALLIFLFAIPATYAANYIVGDSAGWGTGVNYNNWASGKTFNVGDSLLFSYGGLHTVDEVSASDYSSCNSGSAINSYNDGNTNITLSTPGPHYFICQTPGHCGGGMKLQVAVTSGSSSTPTPVTPSTPTPTGSSTPTTPTVGSSPATRTPSSLSPTPPSLSGANDMNSLFLGAPILLAALLAIMG
ncbi:mavicyanin-like [Tasmannia lanceolata]|uniref:mavicyanin-like n=1 Tax=Tasmannia lanceolata TaxID=3420 RepID=UPI00406443C7